MSVTAIIGDIMHNASGFLMGLFKGKAESAFGALFSKEQADEAALEAGLVQANDLDPRNPDISKEFMEIIGKLNEHQNELVRKTIGMLMTMDEEAAKGNKDFKPITPRAIRMIVDDLKGKDAPEIAKRLSTPDSPLWQKIFNDLKLQWPEAYEWVKNVAEKIFLDTPYWTLIKHRLTWEEKAMSGGVIHVNRYAELLERWLAANPGKTESKARENEDFHKNCLSAIERRAGEQERELERLKRTFLPTWAKTPLIIIGIMIAISAIVTSII